MKNKIKKWINTGIRIQKDVNDFYDYDSNVCKVLSSKNLIWKFKSIALIIQVFKLVYLFK
jgi:hypothetical protein